MFVCLSVCLSQIYRVWWLLIISVASYSVLRAVHPAIASVPILASIQGVPDCVDSHAYHARWEFVHGSFVHHTFCLSVTLREEHRLGVFEIGMLRKVFGYQRGELTGDWRRLHDEKLHDFMLSLCVLLCYIHTYVHVCMYTYVHTYIYTYIYTYVRTYVRLYVCLWVVSHWKNAVLWTEHHGLTAHRLLDI